MYQDTEMRAVFAGLIDKEMEADPDVVMVDADLSRAHGTLSFYKKYPDRVFNAGVAEADMVCIAAGLASYGFKPIVSSFTPFMTRRVCDQVTLSVAYAKQKVLMVGTDPGIAAELNGGTHMSTEDVSVMRNIPGMVVFEPVDGDQLARAFPQIMKHSGPVYMRLFRKVAPQTFFADASYDFDLFKADVMQEGADVTLFASGIEVKEAVAAAEMLKNEGIAAEVVNVHTIKPLDEETVVKSVAKTGCAVTCENHSVLGGLGSAVAECLARNNPAPLEFIGIQDHFGEVGKMNYLMEAFKMGAGHIADAARKVITRKKA